MRTFLPTLAVVTALSGGCGVSPQPGPSEATGSLNSLSPTILHAPSPLPWSGTTVAFDDERAQLDLLVNTLEKRVLTSPNLWLYREQAAGALLSRARLTGSWDDYARADQHLESALSEPTAVPWGTLASLQHSLHRFDALPGTLDHLAQRFPQSDHLLADVAMRRGNLELSQGDYSSARDSLERSVLLRDTPSSLGSLAVWHWRIAEFDVAESLFVRAASSYHGVAAEPRAWFHMNLGLLDLDRGRWQEALSHYRDAERELSGSWLVDEHIAEVLVLLGETERAEAIYRAVIERTDGPEFMDALAGLLAARGDKDEAAAWSAEARTRWDALLLRFPEAAYGHALGHYLDAGDAPARALELAAANHSLRPDGEAKVLLAQALLALDRIDEAVVTIKQALSTPHRSADLHAAAAIIFAAAGDEARALAEQQAATSMNPLVAN